MPTTTTLLPTPHATISLTDTGPPSSPPSPPSPAILLLHSNSLSSKIFLPLLPSLSSTHRTLTLDLPGHGSSSDATIPSTSYTMSGYAEVALDVLEGLGVKEVVVVGWSLGGHVGVEMLEQQQRGREKVKIVGLVIVGTPPARGAGEIRRGFRFSGEEVPMAGRRGLGGEGEGEFVRGTVGSGWEGWMEGDVRRADGRAREVMWESFAGGKGADQRRVVEEEKEVLVGVINGADEPFVNLDYLDAIQWGNLWRGECIRIEGAKHAPHWEKREEFEKLLQEFLADVEKIGQQ
ncbi:alpha/beta-hydrolase [Polyplosphaeria fusca]|uniref:Alpha/beta-hydrolase n=1 Tax=Polyplosphaeria fusca TaxID=682080 RepID=A0A9P4UW26_9PLEO|nr:alpha/beta-hydrolase [Polyplosphaeria fusca]